MREAVARCPQCTRYFCRECVTEHEGRLMCRGCLAAASAVEAKKPRNWGAILWPALGLAGWLFAWMLAYYVGDLLSRIPNSWHGAPTS